MRYILDKAIRTIAKIDPGAIHKICTSTVNFNGFNIRVDEVGYRNITVKNGDTVVYKADGYNNMVFTFVPGPWVDMLIARAKELLPKENEEEDRFSEIDL